MWCLFELRPHLAIGIFGERNHISFPHPKCPGHLEHLGPGPWGQSSEDCVTEFISHKAQPQTFIWTHTVLFKLNDQKQTKSNHCTP